jgi:hypothetical protein
MDDKEPNTDSDIIDREPDNSGKTVDKDNELKKQLLRKEKLQRASQSEERLDEMIDESFPASDAPANY